MPSTWSPSTTRAVPSTAMQPVRVAVEREADVGALRRRRPRPATPGAVAPQPTLMFTPSGSLWMTLDVGAGRRPGSPAPTTPPDPLAQSSDDADVGA